MSHTGLGTSSTQPYTYPQDSGKRLLTTTRKIWLAALAVFLAALLTACGKDATAGRVTGPAPTSRPTFTPLAIKTSQLRPTVQPTLPAPVIASSEDARPTGVSFDSTEPYPEPLHFIMVQHARCAWDPYWCPVEQGILDAAREMNVTVEILGPDSVNLEKTAAQIGQAVAAKPDGIALTVSDPQVLRQVILRAIESGIPVVGYDAGAGPIKDDLPYLTHLGMDNYQGGYLAGNRMIKAGARAGVCIIHAPDLTSLHTKCKGFQDAFNEQSMKADILETTMEVSQAKKDILAYAQAHPEVNAYLTTGPVSAAAFYAYSQTAGLKPGETLHGTFDLSPEIAANIENGATLFGIDQQPYLQGYEAVFWLSMVNRYGLRPALPVTATGPRFVDRGSLHTQADPERPIRLIFVQHALCTWDAYWCVMEQSIRDAARDMNVQVEIWGPDSFDLNKMAALIEEAIVAHPDGMGVTVPDSRILHNPILQAIQAGLPVVAYDTAAGPVKDNLPYLSFFGVDARAEYQGGHLAAYRLMKAGARAGVCVNHQMGHVALDARCQGMSDAFAKEGLKAEVLDSSGDPEEAFQRIRSYAESHPQVNAFLTLGAVEPGAISFYRYLEASGRKPGEILHGTFDLSPAVAEAIENGTTLFAIDGQPYLQGYSAVMFLTLYLRQGIWPASPITPTGPGFVDKSNIAIVKQLAGKYR